MIDELDRSGLSVAQFAAQHDLEPQRIYFWLKRGEEPAPVGARLVEFKVPEVLRTSTSRGAERIEVELSNGRRVSVAESIDVEALRRIVAALEC